MTTFRWLIAISLFWTVAASASSDRRHDEHSYAEPAKVSITSMALDLTIDFETKTLSGEVIHSLKWSDPGYLSLNLDTRDLQINRVSGRNADGRWRKLKFSVSDSDPQYGARLQINSKRQYEQIRIRYSTSPGASGLQWLEPQMTAGGALPFMFSQSQAIHARSWVPLQDTPGVRFTYTAKIHTPASVMALMSADNDPNAARDGEYVFSMPQPIPSYLMAIAAGDLKFKAISERSGVWAEPSVLDRAVKEFEDTEKMIVATEKLYGPYRWGRYDLLILPPSFPFGGMENPRLSFITPTVIVGDKTLVSLIAHELAHSWSGNLVTNASWKDMWLNEGFTSYVENRIVEDLYGIEQAAMENVISQNGLKAELAELSPERQLLMLAATPGGDPEDALSDVAYIKGQWFLIFLEKRFGREVFDPFLKRWFDSNAFKSVTTEDFVQFLRSDLFARKPGAVTEAELNQWISGPGVPATAPASQTQRFAAVDASRALWLNKTKAARELDTGAWITQEWVYFLEGMPADIATERLIELDQAFRFTGSANGEIAQRWYPITIRAGYFEARPALGQFLRKIGRRKLIMPSYQALAETADGLAFAKQVYALAKAGYHPITRGSVEAVLQKAEATAE